MFSFAQATAGIDPVIATMKMEKAFSILNDPARGWEFQDFVAPDLVNSGVDKGQIPWFEPEADRKEESLAHAEGKDPTPVDVGGREFRDYTLQPYSGSLEWSSKIARDIAQSGTDPDAELDRRIFSLAKKLWLEERVALVTKLTTAGNYDATCTGAVTAALSSDSATFDTDIKTYKIAASALKDGAVPNALLMTDIAWMHARTNAGLIAKLRSDTTKILSVEEFKMLLDIEYMRITQARRDTGRRGDAGSQSRLLGSNAILFYRPMDINPGAVGEIEFMRTIRNSPAGELEHTVERDDKKTADRGPGAFYEKHIFKAGASSAEFINVIHPSTAVDSTCGCLLTGLY